MEFYAPNKFCGPYIYCTPPNRFCGWFVYCPPNSGLVPGKF